MLIVTERHIINSEEMLMVVPAFNDISTINFFRVLMKDKSETDLTVEEFAEAKEQIKSSAVLEDLTFKAV